MELLSLPSPQRTNQTNGTMIDLQNTPNGKCIADMPKSRQQGTTAQDTNPQINLEQVLKKHLLLQNLVQLRMFAGAERAPPAAEA